MTTLYGGETHGPNDEFKPVDGEALTADMFNYATSFWVADDVPAETEGKDGDVVFVMGDPVSASGGGGKVLQVVHSITKSNTETNRQTFENVPGVSVSVTPKSTQSKIILLCYARVDTSWTADGLTWADLQMLDEQDTKVPGAGALRTGSSNVTGTGNRQNFQPLVIHGIFNPSDLSAKTFRIQYKTNLSTTTVGFVGAVAETVFYAYEIQDVVVSP